MILILVIIYSLLLFILSYKKWDWSLGWLVIILPSYLIRFSIGQLPSTLLEVSLGVIFLVWLIKYFKYDRLEIKSFFQKEKIFIVSLLVFFLSSIIAIFVSGNLFKGLGIWRAYFLEPVLFFSMLVGRRRGLQGNSFFWPIFLSSVVVSILVIAQKFFHAPLAPSLWNDDLGGRATAFFTSPNALGMYLAPMVLLQLGHLYQMLQEGVRINRQFALLKLGILLNFFAIFLSFSRGAWLAIAASMIVMVFLWGYKKVGMIFILGAVVAILLVPTVRTHVFFQDKASQNRLLLWSDSWQYLSNSPTNFIFGTGLRQFFNKIERPHYNPRIIEPLTYPHNIFLNFWTEIGLFGLLGFLGILGAVSVWSYRLWSVDKVVGAISIGSFLTIIIQGLVDVPYFKNDLALIFWIFVFIIYHQYFIQVKK